MNVTEEGEISEAQGGAEGVCRAERGDGVLGAHMHGRVHRGWTVPRGGQQGEEALQQILHVPGASAIDPPLCHVQREDEPRVLALQANVAALQAPRLHMSAN